MKTIALSKLKEVPLEQFNVFQQTWLAALKSGKFKQTKSVLRKGGENPSFCCLGVACEVLKEELNLKMKKKRGEPYFQYNESDIALPNIVSKSLKTENEGGLLSGIVECKSTNDYRISTLSDINDVLKWNFKQIYNLLRRAPWTVFQNFKAPKDTTVDITK